MRERRRVYVEYLKVTEKILIKLRYKVKPYNAERWRMMVLELMLLVIYHVAAIATMGEPTPISLFLNTIIVFRYIIANWEENIRIVSKAKKKGESFQNKYTSVHAMIAIIEVIVVALMIALIFSLGIENNIGQIQFATCVILCISFFEGWKDISVSFFGAKPKVF